MRRLLLVVLSALGLTQVVVGCGEDPPGTTPPVALVPDGENALAVWSGFYKQQKDRIPERLVTNPGAPHGEYVGSRACADCHADEYLRWRKSFHSRTLYDAVQGTVIGDFGAGVIDTTAFDQATGKQIPAPYVAEVAVRQDAAGRTRYTMHVRNRTEAEGWPAGKCRDLYGGCRSVMPDVGDGVLQEVVFAFGNRRHQPYVARWRAPQDPRVDGRHFVLPFYWNDVEKRWLFDGFRSYAESCASCHVTGLKHARTPAYAGQLPLPDVDPRQAPLFSLGPAEEGWSEGAVGCEVCHGPGLEHVRQVDRVGVARYRELRRSGQKPPSTFPATKGSESQARLTQMCDSCHNFFSESSVTFVPGPTGYGRDSFHKPVPLDPFFAQRYPDGSEKSPCSIGAVYRRSKMYDQGVHCFDCHDPHGSDHFGSLKLPIEDNSLCVSCHAHEGLASVEAQTAHSRHAAGSAGNRCVECHMPRHMIFTNGHQMMSDRLHNHVFSIPRGGARPGAPPTACNVCHAQRDEAWSAAEIRRLWPPAEPGPAPAEPSAPAPGPR